MKKLDEIMLMNGSNLEKDQMSKIFGGNACDLSSATEALDTLTININKKTGEKTGGSDGDDSNW